jgi:hypothetical protein
VEIKAASVVLFFRRTATGDGDAIFVFQNLMKAMRRDVFTPPTVASWALARPRRWACNSIAPLKPRKLNSKAVDTAEKIDCSGVLNRQQLNAWVYLFKIREFNAMCMLLATREMTRQLHPIRCL